MSGFSNEYPHVKTDKSWDYNCDVDDHSRVSPLLHLSHNCLSNSLRRSRAIWRSRACMNSSTINRCLRWSALNKLRFSVMVVGFVFVLILNVDLCA